MGGCRARLCLQERAEQLSIGLCAHLRQVCSLLELSLEPGQKQGRIFTEHVRGCLHACMCRWAPEPPFYCGNAHCQHHILGPYAMIVPENARHLRKESGLWWFLHGQGVSGASYLEPLLGKTL